MSSEESFLFLDDLAYNKYADQSHTFPGLTYNAVNAVDRNIDTCMRTELIGQSSIRKKVWWKVNLGGDYNIFSINIQFKTYDGDCDWFDFLAYLSFTIST